MTSTEPRGPVDSSRTPRYAGPATFARLPRLDEVGTADVAVVGVPFDSGSPPLYGKKDLDDDSEPGHR